MASDKKETVGPYTLGETIARGAFGKVKKAIHQKTLQEVAVKVISKRRLQGQKNTIGREIAVMRLLDHPHVLKLYDVLESRHHYFLVMELVDGGELFGYILQNKRLNRKEALRLFAQIVQGIEFCHRHSICHRDLKPENLLLDQNCNIKIADFGMARVVPRDGELDTFCGSPHYGAPEIVSGIPYDGRKSDVWSLGVVLYALISGMLPFDHQDTSKLLGLVKRAKYMIPDFVDDDIADLLRRMLEPDINKRIKTDHIKRHPCFHGDGILYFPLQGVPSPALEQLAKTPIKSEADVDPAIVRDLVELKCGSVEAITQRLLTPYGPDDEAPLELILYMLLLSRSEVARASEERRLAAARENAAETQAKKEAAQLALPAVSMEEPPSPMTPVRAKESHKPRSFVARASSVDSPARSQVSSNVHSAPTEAMGDIAEEQKESTNAGGGVPRPSVAASAPGKPPRPSFAGRKGRPGQIGTNIAQDFQGRSDTGTPRDNYASTPKFHRVMPVGRRESLGWEEPDSARDPVTPSPKVSWFGGSGGGGGGGGRRPSITVSGPSAHVPVASGVYTRQDPSHVRKHIRQIVDNMRISSRLSEDKLCLECDCKAMVSKETWHLLILNEDMSVAYEQKAEDAEASTLQQVAADDDGSSGVGAGNGSESESAAADVKESPAAANARAPALNGAPSSPFRGSLGVPSQHAVPVSPGPGGQRTNPHSAQRVCFNISVTHNPSDKVSTISITHARGHNVVFRAIHGEIIRQLELQ